MSRRGLPEVNAGSMADIAFLLLIFFLVTTTIETNSGLTTKLPPRIDEDVTPPPVKEKNIFQVLVNKNDQLLVEDKLMEVKDLRKAAIDFLDNGGGVGAEACVHCRGLRNPKSSDNPTKAVISLRNDRQTTYKVYMAVQNELVAAYNDLRNRECRRLFPGEESYVAMEREYNDARTGDSKKEKLKEKIKTIQALYPRNLTEAEPKRN